MPGFFHCGTFLLFAAFALLLVSTITAPVIKELSFLNIASGNQLTTLGALGYCTDINSKPAGCTGTALGYSVSDAVAQIGGFGGYTNSRIDMLSKALILHPIGTGLSFIAFFVALLSSRLGYILASLFAFLAFIVTLAAMIVDFVIFGITKAYISANSSTVTPTFGNSIWITMVAVVVLFFAQFIVCFSCLGARREGRNWRGRRGEGVAMADYSGMGNGRKVGTY